MGRKRLWLLSLMRVVRTDKQFQLVEHVSSKSVLGKHAFDGQLQDFRWLLFPQIDGRNVPLTARPAGKPDIALLGHFRGVVRMAIMSHSTTGKFDLISIHNDDVITGVNVRRVIWAMLAH